VQYEFPSEDLHERLFCKYPFEFDENNAQGLWNWNCVMNNDAPEIDFARLLSAGVPMRTSKYYYGDICPKTSMTLLITECLNFPETGDDFGPMELEPMLLKSHDYMLSDPMGYYDAIVRNAGRLAAWGHSGKLGRNVLKTFEYPEPPAMMAMGVKSKIPKYLFFCREVAPQLFPPNYVDEAMEKTLWDTLADIEACQKKLWNYSYADESMIGLTHQNMNPDNAFFWRDDGGRICSGFIDWGRFRQENYAQGIWMGMSCCDLTEFLQVMDAQLLKNFVEEFSKEHKPGVVTFEKMWEHWMLTTCLQALFCVNLADSSIYTSWHHTQPEGWKTIKDHHDPRVLSMPNCNAGWISMIRQFTRSWKGKDIPGWWKEWRTKHKDELQLPPTPEEKAKAAAEKKAAKEARKG